MRRITSDSLLARDLLTHKELEDSGLSRWPLSRSINPMLMPMYRSCRKKKDSVDADSLVSFDGKDHISASRAAKITGYHPDYVGQLARSGAIISRQVGNRWYVDRAALLSHKKEK